MENSIAMEKIKKAFSKYQLFYVGGFVRDSIMGIVSHDIDLATDADVVQMQKICLENGLNFRYTENSIAHGTIVIENIEVTTFRKDVSCDGRNATVEFARTIQEDLARRDFTINAIAQNVFSGELVDPFNGVQDINDEVIRAVGNPTDRLKEDTLRAIRAIRFANRFGFSIEENLKVAIVNTDISNLSVERVRDEFMKILETRDDNYFYLILHKVIPEFSVLDNLSGGDKHNENVDIHSTMTVKHVMVVSPKPLLAFAGLLHDIGKAYTLNEERMFKGHEDVGAEKVKEIMERMKFSNDDIEYVYTLIKNHMRWHFYDGKFLVPSDKAIKRAIRDLPDTIDKKEMIKDLCILTWADCQANLLNAPESFEDYMERRGILKRTVQLFREAAEFKPAFKIELNGDDLKDMGYKPSPQFSVILKDVFNKVVGECKKKEMLENDKEILKKYVMENYER